MRKKILIISMAYYPRFIGGAEVSIKELTDRLSDEYDFHMVTLRYDSSLPRVSMEGNVLVHRIGPSFSRAAVSDLRKWQFRVLKVWFQFAAFFKAQSLHKKEKYDMVWGMMAHSAGVPAVLFKRFNPSVSYMLSLQEGDPPQHIERQMRIFGPLFKSAFRSADVIQSLSIFLADWGLRMGGRKVIVIPNGVDVARFSSTESKDHREDIRNKFNIPQEVPLFITASRLVPKNGVDLVIGAFQYLPEDVHFLIAGEGPECIQLEKLARKGKGAGRIHFVGEISQAELPYYLGAADYFIRASRSEGQGIAFIEALAAGLPTIGTDVGGIPDFLHDGETGFLAETCDTEGVAYAMNRALEDAIATAEIAKRGNELSNTYDWNIVAMRMKNEVFEPLLRRENKAL